MKYCAGSLVKTATVLCLLLSSGLSAAAPVDSVTLAVTTSTENSGLLSYLLPKMEAATAVRANVLVSGTGQALRQLDRGDADLVIVHDPVAEARFVETGKAAQHALLMHNYFLLVGPPDDPAGVAGSPNIAAALAKIGASDSALFVSRGDISGTHQRELRLWNAAGIDVGTLGNRYLEGGAGMGRILLMAREKGAYTLSDGATWRHFNAANALQVLYGAAPDPELYNPYSVIVGWTESGVAIRVAEWLLGPEGQREIANYKSNSMQVFFPGPAQ